MKEVLFSIQARAVVLTTTLFFCFSLENEKVNVR